MEVSPLLELKLHWKFTYPFDSRTPLHVHDVRIIDLLLVVGELEGVEERDRIGHLCMHRKFSLLGGGQISGDPGHEYTKAPDQGHPLRGD